MEDYDRQKRRQFQEIKGWSNDRFWNWMNQLHSKAYFKAVGHYTEASETILPPRYQKPLHEQAKKIREEWDGINQINIDFSELTLQEVLLEVQREMSRAAGIHGVKFISLEEAHEAIEEEYWEVWEAIAEKDINHAREEIVQLIGVLVKLMRDLNELVVKT